MRVRAALRVASGIAVLVAACNTPTIPLPPPRPEAEDVVVARYAADPTKLVFSAEPAAPGDHLSFPPRALVSIYNDDVDVGVLAPTDGEGRFETEPITGEEGDRVRIWYVDEDGELSVDLCLLVALGRQTRGDVCP